MMPARCSDGPARKRARALQDDDDAADDAQDDAPTCEVCGRHPRKYCCPRCACVTCSLACCAAHKRATGCDGRRDAAAHRPLKAMGLRELRADCAFLEAAARSRATAERARRTAPRLGGRERRRRSGEAPAAARLRRAAERRRIRLLLMPDGMVTTRADDGDGENARTALFSHAQAKRRRNGSHYDAARDAIRWRVEWRVDGATLVDERADERTPLRELLAAHAAAAGRRPPVACDLQDPETFALLLLRAPGPANDPRYDRLDPSVGLDLNLADRCVIEYPQIVVARPGDVDRRFRLAPNPVQLFFADDQSTSAGGHGEMRRA